MYENLSNSTLDELAEYFQELPEFCNCPEDYDVQYGVSNVDSHVCLISITVLYYTEWGDKHQGWK